jgi:hypothetical protein
VRLIYVAIFASAVFAPSLSHADDAGNITACAKAARDFAGRDVDEFDAQYDGALFGFSIAEWPGVLCEVKMETVFNLTIDSEKVIF